MKWIFATIILTLLRSLLICVIGFLLNVSASAQKSADTRVIWGPDENCHAANSREVKADQPKCSLVNVGDENFRIVSFRGISFAINSRYFVVGKRNYVRSALQLTNSSGAEVQVDPKAWAVYGYTSEAEFLNGSGAPKIIKTTRASNVKLPMKVTVLEAPASGGPAATQGISKVEAVKPPGQLTAKDRATIQESNPLGPTLAVTVSGISSTSGPSREVRENELVKKRVGAGDKAAGYIFFLDVPQDGHVVTVVRLNSIELIFPIQTSP